MTKRPIKNALAGFTMVEIMVVVIIIALLVTILVPSVMRVQRLIGHSRSQGIVNLIDGACRMYYQDFKVYPDSTPMTGTPDKCYDGKKMYGRHRVVEALTGYIAAAPATGLGDGADGYGFRVPGGKVVYGPYNGTEKLATQADASVTGSPLVFIDTFDNPIFYYRFDETTGVKKYNDTDNNDVAGDAKFASDGIPNSNPMLARTGSGSYVRSYYECTDHTSVPDKFFQTTFLLMSAGADKTFDAWQTKNSTDDVTNFLSGAK